MPQQPFPVLGEGGGVEAGLHEVHVQKPAEQDVVVQLFTEGPLAAHGVQRDQQTCLQQPLWRDGRPTNLGVHAVKRRRQFLQRLSATRLMVRNGWVGGTRVSASMNVSMLTWGSCRPRTGNASCDSGFTSRNDSVSQL